MQKKLPLWVDISTDAVIGGIELDECLALSRSLKLNGAIGHLDIEYTDFTDGNSYHDQPRDAGSRICDYTGRESQYTSLLSSSPYLTHSLLLGGLELLSTLDANYVSKHFIHPTLTPTGSSPATPARLALNADSWTLALVGKNLTDEKTLSYTNTAPLSTSFGLPAHDGFVEAPRTIGTQGTVRF